MSPLPGAQAVLRDLRVLYRLARSSGTGANHAERMERFYREQAAHYDAFRARLLHGRERLLARLPLEPGATWVDLGAGTGSNLAMAAERVPQLAAVWLVDLAPSLLAVAQRRIAECGWNHVRVVEGDATAFALPSAQADVVTLSYALTMIPDWFAAVDQALRLLRPGGTLGIVDFYVSRKHPSPGMEHHGWLTRNLWPLWFAHDNVHLSPDHLPYLRACCTVQHLEEARGRVPYLPGLRVPYYLFVGTPREPGPAEISRAGLCCRQGPADDRACHSPG